MIVLLGGLKAASFFGGMLMIRELVHDPFLLARKSAEATKEDLNTVRDLLDTLAAHKETCVGMAANMIGQQKRIIAFSGEYETEEGCLSLLGGPRKCKRYQKIKVRYQNEQLQTRMKTFTGWTAQIIQHEVDHCNGVLI